MATHAARFQPPAAPAAGPTAPLSLLGAAPTLLRFSTAMAVLLGVAALPTSSLFTVRAVRVEGAVTASAAALVALAGLHPGDRLFAVPAPEITARVASHPRIARAAVRIRAPGDVVIRVVERTAYAAFPFRGAFYVLDRGGIVFEQRPSAGALPVVTAAGFIPAWVRLGDRLPAGGVDLAREALEALPAEVIAPGTRIAAQPDGTLVLRTPDGIAVRLGPLRGLEERAALLGELLQAVRARGLAVEYLDLRFSGNVVMKPAGAAAPGAAAGEGGSR